MYSLSTAVSGKPMIELIWQMGISVCDDGLSSEMQTAEKGRSVGTVETSQASQLDRRSGRGYHYADVFTMAEVNPSWNVFAVKEKVDGEVSVHLFSTKGELLRSASIGEKSVVLLSTYNSRLGMYSMVVQGGHVIILDAESLEVKHKFKAVSKLNVYLIKKGMYIATLLFNEMLKPQHVCNMHVCIYVFEM